MGDYMELIEKLKDVHDFPCEYVFKAVGDNSEAFEKGVKGAISGHLSEDDLETLIMDRRESRGGKHVGLTVRVRGPDAKTVIDIHESLADVPGTRFVL